MRLSQFEQSSKPIHITELAVDVPERKTTLQMKDLISPGEWEEMMIFIDGALDYTYHIAAAEAKLISQALGYRCTFAIRGFDELRSKIEKKTYESLNRNEAIDELYLELLAAARSIYGNQVEAIDEVVRVAIYKQFSHDVVKLKNADDFPLETVRLLCEAYPAAAAVHTRFFPWQWLEKIRPAINQVNVGMQATRLSWLKVAKPEKTTVPQEVIEYLEERIKKKKERRRWDDVLTLAGELSLLLAKDIELSQDGNAGLQLIFESDQESRESQLEQMPPARRSF